MNRTLTRSTIFALLLLALCSPLHSQSIWPGDINNNGRVNGVDWLYWGLGNQQTGPVRPGASLSWEAQPMGSPWGNQFPTGNNYAYADVDGNGVINMSDAQGIATNFGLSHGLGVPDNYPTAAANAPAITLERGEPTAMPEEIAKVGFALGSADRPLENLYGLTFVLEYPPKALLNEGLYFATEQGLFMGQDGNAPRVFIRNDSLAGRAEITITRTNQVPESGYGEVGKFFLRFSDLSSPTLPDTLTFAITKVMAIDAQMNTIPLQKSSMFFLLGDGNSGNNPILGPCPPTVAPVCGSNGVTYLNSCYAEAAGIFDYTPGTCFGPCVDPGLINAAAVCPAIYDPVCGCNGITYANECEAEAAGVTSTSPGPCAASSCYDPQYVLSSAATTLDPVTGIITADIPSTYDPVCGCNGVTYNNAYQAQASGITSYTPGTCESACIDATAINPDATCLSSYNPVCGCNEVTYANACRAEAAGVTSYTSGPCGGNSPWCATAIPIYCGDFLAAETTIGAGNNLLSYPGCSNTLFQGPDRIYMLNKTTAGDLQIGLEILTPGLDLDLFLLADNCSQVTCLRSSTTSNSSTNNEGILLPDAPIGTYYIVVDGQYASSAGNFRLEVSCGYLYCGDAVALSCGQPYSGSNANGSDDVSLYGCDGNIYNVENNGPEVVHTFTTTEA
ncbi:MAG: hypothetical protein KDC54_07130, partial [Lewinella sp.]|nr:hypothetical protein [Lewinella sp.]